MRQYLEGPGFSLRLFLRSGTKLEELFEFSLDVSGVESLLGSLTLGATDSGGVWLSTTTSIAPANNDKTVNIGHK